jgi:hypothetical protein
MHALLAAIVAPIIGFLADQFGIGFALIVISGLMMVITPLYMARRKDLKANP